MINREKVLARLAIELLQIERSIEESQGWMHEGLCNCEQCLYESRKQRKLIEARRRAFEEISRLAGDLA